MKYAIVYSSKTGNTALLANTIRETLPAADCLYCGVPSAQALEAERIYVGFWTDKGTCDGETAAFLGQITNQQVFLFGTAGFGGAPAYFEKILNIPPLCLQKCSARRIIESYKFWKEHVLEKACFFIER